MRIKEAGIYAMPMSEYNADPCETPSIRPGIAHTIITKSPAHAWFSHPRLNPHHKNEENEKFDVGAAAHALTFEGEDRMTVIDAPDWRKADAKNARDAARASGKYPVLAHKYTQILAMRDAAHAAWKRCPDLKGITLEEGDIEEASVWNEGATWLRTRPDWRAPARHITVDYKTTEASAHPDAWIRTMLGCGFEIQGAFGIRGNAKTCGPEDSRFIFMVQEVEPPYAVAFNEMSAEMIAYAMARMHRAVKLWAQCMKGGVWPSYPLTATRMDVPTFAMQQEDAQHEMGIPYDVAKLWEKPTE